MLLHPLTPLLLAHIAGGASAVLAGLIALLSRKGARLHRAAGKLFLPAMLANASSASYFGYTAEPRAAGDIFAGMLTIYLVLTGWAAARRAGGGTGAAAAVAALLVAASAAAFFLQALQTLREGTAILSALPAFIFAGMVLAVVIWDHRMIARLSERERIARHLWRMCLALFVAVGSFFPGQLHLFPEFIRDIRPVILLFLPAFSVLALLFFWLSHVRSGRWRGRCALAGGPAAQSAVTKRRHSFTE